jgi:hypothetical protein
MQNCKPPRISEAGPQGKRRSTVRSELVFGGNSPLETEQQREVRYSSAFSLSVEAESLYTATCPLNQHILLGVDVRFATAKRPYLSWTFEMVA